MRAHAHTHTHTQNLCFQTSSPPPLSLSSLCLSVSLSFTVYLFFSLSLSLSLFLCLCLSLSLTHISLLNGLVSITITRGHLPIAASLLQATGAFPRAWGCSSPVVHGLVRPPHPPTVGPCCRVELRISRTCTTQTQENAQK